MQLSFSSARGRTLALAAAASIISFAGVAQAAHIDGTLATGAYGPAQFIQNTPTGFGDNTDAGPLLATGSEIDGVYGYVSGGALTLLVTGNLETNFNRLVLFVNSTAGGDNVVGTTATASAGPLNDYNGLTFDAGFGADYFLQVNGGGTPTVFYSDFAQIGGSGAFIGQTPDNGQIATFGNGIVFGFDNSNVAGVNGASAAGAAAVTTGLEFSIPLSVIGNPTGDIQIAGFIAGGNFLSNQVFGGVGGAPNLGNASGVNFAQIPGNQFVTIAIPEPASLGVIATAGLAMLRRRRA